MRAFDSTVMAVKAIDPKIARMQLVRKCDGLLGHVPFLISRKWILSKMNEKCDQANTHPGQQYVGDNGRFHCVSPAPAQLTSVEIVGYLPAQSLQ